MDKIFYENRVLQLKNFFKKPLTLIVGILFLLSFFIIITVSVVQNFDWLFLSEQYDEEYVEKLLMFIFEMFIGIIGIFPAISFFIMFFESHTNVTDKTFSVSVTLITVFSIISIVLTSLFSIIVIVGMCFIAIVPFFTIISIIALVITFAVVPIMIVYFSSFMAAFRSVLKSCQSFCIKKASMILLGSMSILICVTALVLLTPSFLIFLIELSPTKLDFSYLIDELPYLIVIFTIFLTNLFLAVWSFSYVRYAGRINAKIKH